MKEQEIFKMLFNKEQQAITLLLSQYGGMFAHIVRNTGIINQEDVEECISDIVYKIWKRAKKFNKEKASFSTFITLIARGCAIDYVRKHKKHWQVLSLDIENSVILSEEDISIDYQVIVDKINILDPPDDQILYQKYIIGEEVAYIAKSLGISIDNVYKRISRAKKMLQVHLTKEGIL